MRIKLVVPALGFLIGSIVPVSAQPSTPNICMHNLATGQFSSCRVIERDTGEERCLCSYGMFPEVLTTGSIRSNPAARGVGALGSNGFIGDGSSGGGISVLEGTGNFSAPISTIAPTVSGWPGDPVVPGDTNVTGDSVVPSGPGHGSDDNSTGLAPGGQGLDNPGGGGAARGEASNGQSRSGLGEGDGTNPGVNSGNNNAQGTPGGDGTNNPSAN